MTNAEQPDGVWMSVEAIEDYERRIEDSERRLESLGLRVAAMEASMKDDWDKRTWWPHQR